MKNATSGTAGHDDSILNRSTALGMCPLPRSPALASLGSSE